MTVQAPAVRPPFAPPSGARLFELWTDGRPAAAFEVVRFRGVEELSKLPRFEIPSSRAAESPRSSASSGLEET